MADIEEDILNCRIVSLISVKPTQVRAILKEYGLGGIIPNADIDAHLTNGTHAELVTAISAALVKQNRNDE